MRIERIARDKVRIFISYEDLERRGIDRDEIWHNGKKVQELFWDMMETAYEEVGFEVAGPISIEAFTMPQEGVVVIVTRVPSLPARKEEDDETEDTMDFELPDPLDSNFVFKIRDFEDVVLIAHALVDYAIVTRLYIHGGVYYLTVDENSMSDDEYDSIWAILQEYGEFSGLTPTWLDEYAKCILDRDAIQTIVDRFSLH
ncbi:adaptor protein MecA [Alicyclobacillus mengziensis]|uniref:Adaptor protein MecA n=1 Tax=Alicyclobacillus mengziensis TaxID=2931921 RepID=A0A9X7Z4V9_9BACL|nr:adaptor protein MecA [Alicyclobacillus mengziensis]QSO45752.1 adaptor protein MecA [Alicyclobacillus mengziensis]